MLKRAGSMSEGGDMQVNRQVVKNAGKRTEMYVKERDKSQGGWSKYMCGEAVALVNACRVKPKSNQGCKARYGGGHPCPGCQRPTDPASFKALLDVDISTRMMVVAC